MCVKNNKNKKSDKQSAEKSASDSIKDAINIAFALKGEIGLKFAKKEISAGELNKQFDEIDALITRLKTTLSDTKQHEAVASTITCPASCSVSASSVRYDKRNTGKIKVGDSVRIIGPSVSGAKDSIGQEAKVIHIDQSGCYSTNLNHFSGHVFSVKSLALASKVPAPKFKAGDRLEASSSICGNRSFDRERLFWSDSVLSWCYANNSNEWFAESDLKLVEPKSEYLPTYLPTRYINIGRKECESLLWRASLATSTTAIASSVQEWNTHIIYDMPARPDGRQVHILDLINAGYTFGSENGSFFWRIPNKGMTVQHRTPIEAARTAAEHYLSNLKST